MWDQCGFTDRYLVNFRNMEHLKPTLNITVSGSKSTIYEEKKIPPCVLYNITKLWFQPSPIGHFMHNQWEPFHCSKPLEGIFENCLRQKRLILYGDSTCRQWFEDIFFRFNCTLTTENWTEEKWKKNSAAICPKNNLTLEWVVHAFPGNMQKKRRVAGSTTEHMMKTSHDTDTIFVIHFLCHVTAYHHSVYRDRISHIRQIAEVILKANRNAKILIKGGHTFRDLIQICDYYSYVYRTILIEEFKGLYDKVIYLDNKDFTIAKEVIPNHPSMKVVREMVNQMLSYVCCP